MTKKQKNHVLTVSFELLSQSLVYTNELELCKQWNSVKKSFMY